jgi:ATP-dependent RNA helicase DeaD
MPHPKSAADSARATPQPPAPDAPESVPFAALGLSPAVLEAVARLGFTAAAPIQAATIPLIMAGRDVVGQSETGSGKTAAFCIPAIERIDPARAATQVLVLVPTRELATQVAGETRKLAACTPGVRITAIYGGASYDRQFADLSRGAHIVVGTPGRLVDHLARGTLDLSAVSLLVLDEADRMLDMGFQEDIEKLLAAAPAERQTVFFSATISPPIRDLVGRHSRDAAAVRIAQRADAGKPLVDQLCHEIRHHAKFDTLVRVLEYHDVKSGIIFCNTQRMVDELVESLAARGHTAERLHGGLAQAQRTRVMEGFKRAAFRLLVATDVAARGIDVNDLELVVNYDLPADAEDYVHRIGRTGRAGRKGRAVTLVSGGGGYKLQMIERFTKTRIRREPVPSAAAVETRRSDALFETLSTAMAGEAFAGRRPLIDKLIGLGHAPADVAAAILHHFAPARAVEAEPPTSPPAPRHAVRPRPEFEDRPPPRGKRKFAPVRGDRGDRGGRADQGDRGPGRAPVTGGGQGQGKFKGKFKKGPPRGKPRS